jgi:hypothetical protein
MLEQKIIQAIKNFDTALLAELLDDDKSYMDVTKSRFIKKLEERFEIAKAEGCHGFDDVFFGICESCNKGCEGMTFLSESGYYLDLFIECEDGETINDIYVCNKLTNIVDLEKSFDLGFHFYKDEKVTFRRTSDYNLIEEDYKLLVSGLEKINQVIHLDDFIRWYAVFDELNQSIYELGPFVCFDYKLYSDVFHTTFELNGIAEIPSKAEDAKEGLITYFLAKTEREKLLWFYENKKHLHSSLCFDLLENIGEQSTTNEAIEANKFQISISGYEYIIEYLKKLDDLYDEFMEAYQPLPEHYEQSPDGYLVCTLENYLKLHNKHLDIVERFGVNE